MRVAAQGIYFQNVTVSGRVFQIPWIDTGQVPESSTMANILYRPSGIYAGPGNVLIQHIETKMDVQTRKGSWESYDGDKVSGLVYDASTLPLISSSCEWHATEEAIGPHLNEYPLLFVKYTAAPDGPRVLYGIYSYSIWNGWDISCDILKPMEPGRLYKRFVYKLHKYASVGSGMSQSEAIEALSKRLDAWAVETTGFNNMPIYYAGVETSTPHTYYPTRGEVEYFNFHGVESMGFAARSTAISNAGFYRAYYTAFDNLPQAQQNLIANICDIVRAIKSFSSGFKELKSVIEAGKEAWLTYRYVYNTTISDAKEIEKLAERLYDLTSSSSNLVSYGGCTIGGITYHCAIVVDASSFIPDDILSGFKQLGGRINLTNLWDMIPFSFMVDWFMDVSSILERFDTWVESGELPIKEIWYSFYSSYEDCRTSVYGRWLGSKPSLPPYSCTRRSASGKIIGMRVADTLSIFL